MYAMSPFQTHRVIPFTIAGLQWFEGHSWKRHQLYSAASEQIVRRREPAVYWWKFLGNVQ